MRLICGFMRLDGAAASQSLLDAMVAQMDVPRLRASRLSFREGPIAIAVLDFSVPRACALPGSGAAVIAADVRLDAPAELALELGADARNQDALLLETLRRFGSPERALGDFAFAAWDRDTGVLTCGRDVFGIRPLSYGHKPGELFAFASVAAALHGAGIVPPKLDPEVALRRTVRALRFDDSPVVGIARLPPAHLLEVSRGGMTLRRYWQLDRATVGAARLAPDAAATELRRLMEQAVRSRLPGDGRIGAHLSGGLDSSSIAILAARTLRGEGRTLHAYSFLDRLRNDVQIEDETGFVRECLAQEGGIDHAPIRNSPREFDGFPIDLDLMHPLGAENPEMQVAATAERQGVGLILSGWGGDEAVSFNGRGAMAELFRRGRWRTLGREIGALAKERHWTKRGTAFHEVAAWWIRDHAPKGLMDVLRRARGRKPDKYQMLRDVLSPQARRIAANASPLSLVGDGRENRWRLINGAHIAQRAEVWAQIGARHGLAYAFPLLDRRLVEFALTLPSEYFISGGFKRRPFRDAMRGVLPEKLRNRHSKDEPFPGRNIDVANARETFLARLAAYRADPNVRAAIDLDRLEQLIARLPDAGAVRDEMARGGDPSDRDIMFAVTQAMALASYLHEHGA